MRRDDDEQHDFPYVCGIGGVVRGGGADQLHQLGEAGILVKIYLCFDNRGMLLINKCFETGVGVFG